ncbi:PKD domain-containing protein [Methylomagnum sp.]
MKPGLLYLTLPWLLAFIGTAPASVQLDDPLTFPDTPIESPPRNYARPSATFQAADIAPGLSVDTGQREAVRNFYNALFHASENVPMNWTGNLTGCAAGTSNPAYRDAGLLRINMLRALAGVPAAVTLNDTLNAKAQQAALMMSAQNALSHFPDSAWACHTADGADAASKSNLSLGYAGPEAITFGQMQDEGDNNAAVGHRRWLLYPQTQEMGLGDVAGDGTQNHLPANTVWVQDSHIRDPRPVTRDDFVAWPPPGYIPYNLAFPRWSLSYPSADFSQASVSVRRGGADVPVSVEPLADRIGENTLVWRTSDALLTDPAPIVNGDAMFSVSVRNVRVSGQARDFAYDVTLFDPDRPDTDSVLPQVAGADQPAVGRNNPYTIQGVVPAADGFDWLHADASAFTAVQGAETGLGNLEPDTTPGYRVDTDEFAAAGRRAYHLMDAQSKRQLLTLDRWLMPGLKATLKFQSRLALATTSEAASVQVSLDGGNAWRDVYTQFGNDSGFPVEAGFTPRAIALDNFAGRLIRVRFSFDIPNRRAFTFFSPGPGRGWYVDEVAFEDATALDAPAVAPADSTGHFVFNPPATGDHILAARGTLRGHPLEWGPARPVRAVAAGQNQAPVANAGPDRAVVVGNVVSLDGGGSADPDNGPLAFVWSQTAGPASVTLANIAQPSFTPTVPGSYVFSLAINDSDLTSAADTVTVVVSAVSVPTNQAPAADAGPDRTATVGTAIELNGTASRDPDNGPNPLSFVWSQVSGPTAVSLANTAQPSFAPQAAGSYVFSLTVSDGNLASAPDTVAIAARTPTPLTLLSPNGGENLRVGQVVPVRWQSFGVGPKANLQLQFSKNGVKWTSLKTAKNSGQTTWKVAKAQVGTAVQLRLCGPASLPKATRCDVTDGAFRVQR